MKKGLLILTIIVFLISGFQLTIARHFCGGELASVKISLSGIKASCGMMECVNAHNSNNPILESHCCEDQILSNQVKSDFFPEYFNISKPQIEKHLIYANNKISDFNFNYFISKKYFFPPGKTSSVLLSQADLCIFRI